MTEATAADTRAASDKGASSTNKPWLQYSGRRSRATSIASFILAIPFGPVAWLSLYRLRRQATASRLATPSSSMGGLQVQPAFKGSARPHVAFGTRQTQGAARPAEPVPSRVHALLAEGLRGGIAGGLAVLCVQFRG